MKAGAAIILAIAVVACADALLVPEPTQTVSTPDTVPALSTTETPAISMVVIDGYKGGSGISPNGTIIADGGVLFRDEFSPFPSGLR